MNILVVEDEEHVADVLTRALVRMGNSCVVARNAEQADRLLVEGSIDAVTLDLGIPDREGLEWLESVAEARPELAQKTLVITGRLLAPGSIERLARCGAGLLAKPFTLAHLSDAVHSQLDFCHPGSD